MTRMVQCIHLKAGIIGNGDVAGVFCNCDRLFQGVVCECLTVLNDLRDTGIRGKCFYFDFILKIRIIYY